MALSSASSNCLIKGNRLTDYTQGSANEFFKYTKSNNVTSKKSKVTPKQCKTSNSSYAIDKNESRMKKSSSLHNIENLTDFSEDESKEKQFTNTQIITKKNASYDKQQINLNSELLSRIEREKKQYEAKISELNHNLETRKKDKEILSYEKKNLVETVKLLQKDVKQITSENQYLKHRMKEFGIENEFENDKSDDKPDFLNASGDTLVDACSVTFATLGDSSSMCDQFSDDSRGEYVPPPFFKQTEDRNILDSLSVSTLQDRIQKMEEDNYCTNEELQATMQELVDLQKNLDSLNEDNRCLGFDRAILLESLCEQTQKLQKCRLQIDNLKYLLLNSGSKDFSSLESKLQDLYRISEEENKALVVQNEEFKQTIMSCQNEYKEQAATIEFLREELDKISQNYSSLEEKFKDEMWQREQVESLLKNHNELFRDSLGWVDCSSGVLALVQQIKSFRQTEAGLRKELAEKNDVTELLSSQIKQLEEKIKELHSSQRKEFKHHNIEQLQSQLKENEKELRLLTQNLDVLSQKYVDDILVWRDYERDLLIAVTVANSMKEEKEKELQEMEGRLEAAEQMKKQFQDKVDGKTMTYSTHNKERVMGTIERSGLPSLVIKKTPASTNSTTNNSVKTLIQSIEDQVKAVSTSPKETVVIADKPSHNTNTVPRSGLTKQEKKDIIRTSTVTSRSKEESPVVRRNSELPSKSTVSPEKVTKIQMNKLSECPVDTVQPLNTVVSQASSILQSVSRRTSVTTAPTDHINHYSTSVTKSPSPPPTCTDCLSQLVKQTNKGSKRNALLYWCQTKTAGYPKIEITNFSSSWNDGLALCALLHSCKNDLIDFKRLADATSINPDKSQKRINFQSAFNAAETVGIMSQLDIETMVSLERPDWNMVMNYVTEIYQHFEIDN